jgi:hypothetical protein
MSHNRRNWIVVLLILALAMILRRWIIASDGIAFESDEAIVDLMARHITLGQPIPTFFYGQPYMGSLNAVLVAGGFRLLGESVETGRIVHAALSLLTLLSGYGLARAVTGSARVAAMALLLMAIPTASALLYTLIPLGGWPDSVLYANLTLLLAWQLTVGRKREGWRWGALGLAAGVGWWTNPSIIIALVVAGLLGLRHFSARLWRSYGLAAVAFVLGSLPWWLYNLRHDWEALAYLFNGYGTPGGASFTAAERALGLVGLGLPALYGLREPAAAGFPLSFESLLILPLLLILLIDFLITLPRRVRQEPTARLRAEGWVWLVFGVFALIFLASSFFDTTGRYQMPLWTPASIGLALGIDRLRRSGPALSAIALGLLLAFQGGTLVRLTQSGDGLQFQLAEQLRIPARYDAPLIAFLADEGYTYGYASFWTAYRIAFRSHERVIFDSILPYMEQQAGADANRYPPYVEAVGGAERVVWITQNFPALDRAIEAALAEAGVRAQVREFGPYRVYYDFSRRVSPRDLALALPDG